MSSLVHLPQSPSWGVNPPTHPTTHPKPTENRPKPWKKILGKVEEQKTDPWLLTGLLLTNPGGGFNLNTQLFKGLIASGVYSRRNFGLHTQILKLFVVDGFWKSFNGLCPQPCLSSYGVLPLPGSDTKTSWHSFSNGISLGWWKRIKVLVFCNNRWIVKARVQHTEESMPSFTVKTQG